MRSVLFDFPRVWFSDTYTSEQKEHRYGSRVTGKCSLISRAEERRASMSEGREMGSPFGLLSNPEIISVPVHKYFKNT